MFNITIYGWMIPTIITIVCLVYALFIYNDGEGYLSGIGNLFILIPALLISLVSWIIYAILK